MNEIKKFENIDFGEIRTITIENEPWFVASDICKALDISNTTRAMQRLDDDERANFKLGVHDSAGTNCVNEYGLYSLIMASRKKEAKNFKRWVTHDVLPEIRKTGSYNAPKSPMELLEMHYNAIKEVNGKTERLAKEFEEFKEQMPLLGEELTEINIEVKEKVVECLGGKESGAYQNKNLQRRLYRDIYGQTNRSIGVKHYKSVKRNQLAAYLAMVRDYQPPISIQSEIDLANSQETLKI